MWEISKKTRRQSIVGAMVVGAVALKYASFTNQFFNWEFMGFKLIWVVAGLIAYGAYLARTGDL